MLLIEVRRTVIRLLIGTTQTDVRRIVIRVVKRLRVSVGNAILKPTRITPVQLNLKRIVVRRAGPHDHVDIAITPIWAKEIVSDDASQMWSIDVDRTKRIPGTPRRR